MIAEVFRYKCMEDVSSDWWLFITYSLLFAGFGLHMLQSRHMEKSLSYSLHSLLLGENTGCKSDVVSRFFIIDSINLYIIFLSQVKKEVPLNQRASHLFAIEEYLGTSNSGCFWFRRWRAGGKRIAWSATRGFGVTLGWWSQKKTDLLRESFLLLVPQPLKFNKYLRVVQNTS